MISPAGARRAVVVPVPPGCRAASLPEVAAPATPLNGAGAAACPEAAFAAPAELAELAEVLEVPAEQPASKVAPASMTLPVMRPARAPCRVRPVRVRTRAKLAVFSMPL
jgi:hypothetical protein